MLYNIKKGNWLKLILDFESAHSYNWYPEDYTEMLSYSSEILLLASVQGSYNLEAFAMQTII